MEFTFSEGVERAIHAATRWQAGEDPHPLLAEEILFGLALETECRAAQILRRHGIEPHNICRRWPQLRQGPESDNFQQISPQPSYALRQAARAAHVRLQELPQPLAIATEHLLLGMLVVEGEVASWLAEQGVSAAELERDIYELYGQSPGPIEVDFAELAASSVTAPSTALAAPAAESKAHCGASPEDTMLAGEPTLGAWRVLDAAANRAREAVRVVEDYTRFVLDDRHLTERCKRLRHELAHCLGTLPQEALLAARETQSDVGTQLSLPSEQRRDNLTAVVAANAKRLQESLRTLEEYGKTVSPALGQAFEQLRYQSYTLERAIAVTTRSLERLHEARLYVLMDGCASVAEFEALAIALVRTGVDVVQLRDKRLDDRTLLDRARRLRAITQSSRTLMIVNDRPDLATLSRADGVHVGQEELSVKDARTIVGPQGLVGVSTHCIEQARQAVLDGADYIGVGPTFPSGTKQFTEFTGVELLRAVHHEIRLPAFAIGGIDLKHLDQVLATGFERVAVSGAIAKASDPAAAVQAFVDRLKPPR